MRVGSLVVCVNANENDGTPLKINEIYTVRGIINEGSMIPNSIGGFTMITNGDGVYLEEVTNYRVYLYTKVEKAFKSTRFREIQPPIANIEEYINENTLEPVTK